MDVPHARRHASHVVQAVAQEMFGLDDVTRLALAALFTGGHVLLEGNPGLGKTELVKTVARVLRLQTGRIQFTPDLMPADITGTLMPTSNGSLRFQTGPIFTSLLLADEINRATPKTQSAMLEAMAEKRVTVLGEERSLPNPFVVLATQNPIDHEGTYNLPAAQADRFMFKVRMPVPDGPTVTRIVCKRAGAGASNQASPAAAPLTAMLPMLPSDPTAAQLLVKEISELIRSIRPLPVVASHVTNLYLATNRRFEALTKAAGAPKEIKDVATRFQFGISPRAAGDIMLAAKAWVCLSESDADSVTASHLQAVVVHALRHRLKLSLDDDPGDAGEGGDDQDRRLESLIRQLCVLTAPKDSDYDSHWRAWES